MILFLAIRATRVRPRYVTFDCAGSRFGKDAQRDIRDGGEEHTIHNVTDEQIKEALRELVVTGGSETASAISKQRPHTSWRRRRRRCRSSRSGHSTPPRQALSVGNCFKASVVEGHAREHLLQSFGPGSSRPSKAVASPVGR